jgi:hypothetical protein
MQSRLSRKLLHDREDFILTGPALDIGVPTRIVVWQHGKSRSRNLASGYLGAGKDWLSALGRDVTVSEFPNSWFG